MNAYEQLKQKQQQEYDQRVKEAIRFLLPLVSPYDVSDSAGIKQYNCNPYFNRCVNHIANALIKSSGDERKEQEYLINIIKAL